MSDRIPTLADVCSAIAEGHIAVAIEDSMYQVSALDLRRYFNELYPLSAISTNPDASSHSDTSAWSIASRTSVA